MKCKLCIHWEPPTRDDTPLGRCKRIVHEESIQDDIQYEGPAKWGEEGYAEAYQEYCDRLCQRKIERKAIVSDASGYYAELNTHADFGCCLYETDQV